MNRDLFLAVLAMDAYNQGYSPGIAIEGGPTHGIGAAAFVSEKGDAIAQSASFYAVAYSWNGETVISFRGTDSVASDAWNGYGTFFGESSTQSELAAKFYRNVVGEDIYGTSHNVGIKGTLPFDSVSRVNFEAFGLQRQLNRLSLRLCRP